MTPIPFEPQQMIEGSRTCGAAAMTMVYRCLAIPCEQLAVWHRVAEQVRPGVVATRTHRLALDACEQGLAAVILQTSQPAELLADLCAKGLRVIVNHRLDRGSHLGHYSVVLRFDGSEIELHDPHHGPHRVLPWHEFQELWTPNSEASEIVGGVLVAVGGIAEHRPNCPSCGRKVPDNLTCERCGHPIPIGANAAVSCTVAECPGRLWKRLFCPNCDWAAT